MTQKMKIGIIGTGNISGIYIKMSRTFEILDLVACADIDMGRAQAKATETNIPRVCTVKELLDDPEIELVINLTPPFAHYEVAMAVLQAGKSVYNEKPLAIQRAEAQRMLQLAADKGLRIGCAPDTFLGAGIQTCRKLIDEGAIGKPVAANAFMLCHGHESWHPDPEFYYMVGGGPLYDMGPYYLTALINLIGPVKRVTGSTRISFPERTITSQPKHGKKITVETPTHLATVMDFANGAIGVLVTSFDTWAAELPRIEIYGSEGTLSVPDPNTFGGPVRLWRPDTEQWQEIPLVSGWPENSRSLGVADMAHALRSGRPHRASGALAYHVLDIICAAHEASQQGKHIELTSHVEQPTPLPLDLPKNRLDN